MNKNFLFLGAIIILLYSCQTNIPREKEFTYRKLTERLIPIIDGYYLLLDTSAVYSVILPKNYQRNWLQTSDGNYDYPSGDIVYYGFKNNAIIYFSHHYMTTLNFENIFLNMQDSIIANRFIEPYYYFINKIDPPLMILEGVDSNGLYWKDVRYEWTCYGYKNVSLKDKSLFDEVIKSIRRLR